jgi:hypothetical protein
VGATADVTDEPCLAHVPRATEYQRLAYGLGQPGVQDGSKGPFQEKLAERLGLVSVRWAEWPTCSEVGSAGRHP